MCTRKTANGDMLLQLVSQSICFGCKPISPLQPGRNLSPTHKQLLTHKMQWLNYTHMTFFSLWGTQPHDPNQSMNTYSNALTVNLIVHYTRCLPLRKPEALSLPACQWTAREHFQGHLQCPPYFSVPSHAS